LKIYVASVFTFLVMRIDIVIVQQRLGSEEAGLLSVAVSMADALAVLPVVVGSILFPELAKEENAFRKWEMTKRAAVLVGATMAAVLACISAIAGWLIPVLFGESFRGAVPLFLWMAPGVLFLSVTSVFSSYVASVGQPLLFPIIAGLGLLIVVTVEVSLVAKLGTWFAAACISSTCLLFAGAAYAASAVYNKRIIQGC
jgi:O-antigen/teichoic acid export membrane protein